jgi:putative endonuclease
MEKTYYVYIMASKSKVIYTGMTNNLENRVYQHKFKVDEGFTKRYNTYKLVWYDETDDVIAAIEFEKTIKGWLRKKKIALIEENNSGWKDLAEEWFK